MNAVIQLDPSFLGVSKSDTQDGSQSDGEHPVAIGCAILLILCSTAINCAGVKQSALVSILLTATKVFLVLAVFVLALCFAIFGGARHGAVARENLSPASSFRNAVGLARFGSSLVACLWSFDGFADTNFLMEELADPLHSLPRIMRAALLVVTGCYLLVNIAYLCVLSPTQIVGSGAIAVEFAQVSCTHRRYLITLT
jgi:L-type amino acid transporter 9